MATLGAPSRFAVLKVDVSEPIDRKKRQHLKNNQENVNAQQQKKSKQQQQQQNKKQQANKTNKKKKDTKTKDDADKFDEWKKRDEKIVEDLYESELQEALLRSRLDQATVRETPMALPATDVGDTKRKGRVTLSLQEFNEKFPNSPQTAQPVRSEPLSKLLAQRKLQEEEEEEKLRKTFQSQAASIVAKEKIQQQAAEQAAQPRFVSQQEYDKMLDMKKKQIEHMAKVLNITKKELAISQEQNADLESMLKQAELKSKVVLIRELTDLRQVRDELTEQISTLVEQLEQERSKVHALTEELLKRR